MAPDDLDPPALPKVMPDMAERKLDSRTVTKSEALALALRTYWHSDMKFNLVLHVQSNNSTVLIKYQHATT